MATMSKADDLRAELARIEQEDAIDGEVVTPPSDGLVLTIRDEEFECRRVGTSWQMMQFAKARQASNIVVPRDPGHDVGCECPLCKRRAELEEKRNDAGMKMLATLYDTAMVLLKPHERDRYTQFMDDQSLSVDGIGPGELEQAIGNAIGAAAGEPGKADTPTLKPSSVSSVTTSESAPADLSHKATAKVVNLAKKSSTV